MLKLIYAEPFFDKDEPTVRIINTSTSSGLIKSASDNRIIDYISKLQPEKGKTYVHILAMTASEYYGANRNSDWWPENNLIDYYKTFETSPAHIFRGHVNKDPNIAIGQIIFAVYNSKMHRVELVGWIDNAKGADVVDRINKGEWPATSMAAKTPWDICSICGNKAHTRQEYCSHLSEELGRIYPDGRKVCAINSGPLRFFDLSIVGKPADPNSSILQKVAFDEGRVIGSAELAEIEGLTEKEASLKKLSEFVKEITGGVVVDSDPSLDAILDKVKDPDHDAIDILRNYDLKATLCSLAHLGISPSLGWLAELIARKTLGKGGEGIGDLVEGYIKEVGTDGLPIAQGDFGEPVSPNIAIVSALTPSIKQASLMPEYVAGRAFGPLGAYVPGTNVGYIGNGPHIEETPYEKFRRENLVQEAENAKGLAPLVKTLMVIGGAALAAKWYITQLIEQKMREHEASMIPTDVKIRLVEKRAEDHRSTHRLAQSAMVRVLKGT